MNDTSLPPDPSNLPPPWQSRQIDRRELESKALPSLVSIFRTRGSFSNVDDAIIDKLEQRTRPAKFCDGEVICQEGMVAEGIFVIISGEIGIVRQRPGGTAILVNVLRSGDWGGIMGLLGNHPPMARLIARGEVIVRAIRRDALIELMEDLKGFSAGLLACLGQRIHDDSLHLSAALHRVTARDPEVAEHCSPHERLMLDTIRQRVVAADSLEEIMEFVFDAIPHEPGMRMALSFVEDPGGRIICHWTKANYTPLILPDNYEEDLVDSIMEESFRTTKSVTIDDLEDFACHHPFNQGAVKRVKEGLRNCIVSPLRVGSRVIGFMMRSSKSLRPIDEGQVRFLQAIADSIGPIVEKSYRIEMLTRANKNYSDALSFISHELQSPIASMVTDARLMEEGYLGELNEKQVQKIRRSIQKGEYLLRLIRSYLNIARLEAGSLVATMATAVDVDQQVVRPELELLESELEEKKVGVQYNVGVDRPTAECDATLLRIAVGNLLRNAIEYGREGRDIRVSIAGDAGTGNGDAISIAVWNEGPGFSEQQRTRLFRKFSRLGTPGSGKSKGTGIGLYSTSRIMHLHHGLATAQSDAGHWAEFKLTLPVRQPPREAETPYRATKTIKLGTVPQIDAGGKGVRTEAVAVEHITTKPGDLS